MLKGYAFLGLFSGISGNAGIIGISGKSPIIPIIPSVPIVPYINLCALRTILLRQNCVMPRLNKYRAKRSILFTFQFLPFSLQKRSCLTRLLCRYACSQNAHLRSVNSAFSSFASLKLALVIQLLNQTRLSTKLVGQPRSMLYVARCYFTKWLVIPLFFTSLR